jgi:hypothetical protein
LPASPSRSQVNTRVWLTELSRALGRVAKLDDMPDAEVDRVAGMGFDWVWLLSVWRTGPAAQQISRSHPARLPGGVRVTGSSTSFSVLPPSLRAMPWPLGDRLCRILR